MRICSNDMNRSRVLRRARRTQAEQRKRRGDMLGGAIIAATLAGCVAFGAYAVRADAERGLTVSESLCTAGIGCTAGESAMLRGYLRGQPKSELQRFAAETRQRIHYAPERPAAPARLIGRCNGQLYAGNSESSFPAGCAWIEPIRDDG